MKLELKKIGNSTGLILPKELLARLGLSQGDSVIVNEGPNSITISRESEELERGLEIARKAIQHLPRCFDRTRQMTEPIWLSVVLVIAFHDEQLREFGGPAGIREFGMLESALGRPRNKWAYGETDLARLAAAYGYGLAKNHPFVDGNKRAALLAIVTFLGLNGIDFVADNSEAVLMIRGLASGEILEEGLARWIRDRWPA